MWKKCLMTMALAGVTASHAFAPHTGTWIVTSEANGKPGRGLAIDVQGNTLVMQMYAYDANGNATFYMTSGTIANNQFSSALNKYRGGRYLGSGDLIGQDAGSAGTVSLRFDSGTTGFITLPGEPEKAINRFNFAYGSARKASKALGCSRRCHRPTRNRTICSSSTKMPPASTARAWSPHKTTDLVAKTW